MDDTLAPLPIDISSSNLNGIRVLNGIKKDYNHLNDLKILDSIKSNKLLVVVTGNAPNKITNIIHTETKTTNDCRLMGTSLRIQKIDDQNLPSLVVGAVVKQ